MKGINARKTLCHRTDQHLSGKWFIVFGISCLLKNYAAFNQFIQWIDTAVAGMDRKGIFFFIYRDRSGFQLIFINDTIDQMFDLFCFLKGFDMLIGLCSCRIF